MNDQRNWRLDKIDESCHIAETDVKLQVLFMSLRVVVAPQSLRRNRCHLFALLIDDDQTAANLTYAGLKLSDTFPPVLKANSF